MTAISPTKPVLKDEISENRSRVVFFIFCLWTFVLLCRPQDIFPLPESFRPALTMGILVLVFVAMKIKDLPGPPFLQDRQVKYYVALLLIMIMGVPTSLYPRLSFMDIFTGYSNAFLFFFIFYKLVSSIKRLSTVLLVSCLGIGLYSAYALIAGGVPESERLYFGDMFDPNDLAFLALGFLPLNLIFISRDHSWWIRLACICCFIVGVLLILKSGSRGGFLAFGIVMILLLFMKTQTIKFSLKTAIVFICVMLVGFASINTDRYHTLAHIQDDYNVYDETGRFTLWAIGVRAMLSNPLTGVGMGRFSEAVGRDRETRGAQTLRWQTAHNSVVQIGAETGVIGMVLFLLLSKNVFSIFFRTRNLSVPDKLTKIGEMGFIGFAGMFVAAMFLSQAYSMYWAYYVAISAVVNQLIVREQARAVKQ